uniref:Putative ovule protein n=1 Tax=Solanum chacoense TaxID=4108 RepID=A0A0V0GZ69_SOLCH
MKKKRLVESSGQLFLVDMSSYNSDPNEVDRIRIYWLDKQKHEWTRVYKLVDRIFFVGDDCCFSVSSKDFGDQCRGNCIYYNMLRKYDSKFWVNWNNNVIYIVLMTIVASIILVKYLLAIL